ncbi:MAG TPA: hypothetical protein VFK97_02650, partial [Candidatus Saccharimonadales bacterium]|nr:hypothetical protein [Candidatus Saccharimonadales bacterium]
MIHVRRLERPALVAVLALGLIFGGTLIGHSLWSTHGGIPASQYKNDKRTIARLIRLTNSQTKVIAQLSAKLLVKECDSR